MSILIETKRLLLRDYVQEDLPVVHKLVEPSEIWQYQHWGPNSLEDTQKHIDMCISQQSENPRKSFELSITDKATKEIDGAIGIRIRSNVNKAADLGYWIRLDKWGQGLATEATKAIIEFGFETLKMNRIWATASPENIGSLKVLEKSGMKREGLMKKDVLVRGQFRDSVLMAVLRKESNSK